jgi:hypothetical protein
MTSLGPCITHWGSRGRVGVKVRVGRCVSVGGAVGVPVGNNSGVTVGNWVGEGDEVGVVVGASVGVEETTIPNPPQAMSKRVSTDIPIKSFFVILGCHSR